MSKKFEIKIIERTTEMKTIGKEWKQGAGPEGGYGYTPEVDKSIDIEEEIYSQKVNDLNLDEVIKAVNGLK